MDKQSSAARALFAREGNRTVKIVLHVDSGLANTLRGFAHPPWMSLRVDISEVDHPDFVGMLSNSGRAPDASINAVLFPHGIQRLHPHEASATLRAFAHVLKPDGFAVIACPDDGHASMSCRSRFTTESLKALMHDAGFPSVLCLPAHDHAELWCIAWKQPMDDEAAFRAAAGFLPDATLVSVLSDDAHRLNEQAKYSQALNRAEIALELDATNLKAHCSRTFALLSLHRHDECILHCEEGLARFPGQAPLLLNKAAALAGQWRNEEALACYEGILTHQPDNARALYSSAVVLRRLGRRQQVAAMLRRALELAPDEPWALGALVSEQTLLFDWNHLDQLLTKIRPGIAAGQRVIEPLRLLALCDDPQLLLDATRIYVEDRAVPLPDVPAPPRRQARKTIRVGYFSSDFRNHPVLDLIAEVLASHDRTQFEIHAFSFIFDDGPEQATARACVDRFHDVGDLTPRELVDYARANELDIAIDLNGHTQGARSMAFATRLAPVQIAWLGYPGTMGAPYIDYILADDTVIPPTHRRFYTEKVLSLPHCFQPNDSKRAISTEPMTRAQFGLPDEGTVYCCFNSPAKVMPRMLDAWAAVLKDVEGSVLWIFGGDQPQARAHLRDEVAARGIAPDRIIFAERLDRERHLARHRLADLFLDTFPFNAGATAACAIWAGLPILTLPGVTFASRYGASIVTAAGMEELIATDLDEYRHMAVALGRDRERTRALKAKLLANHATAPLFDIPRFVQGLEEAYRRVVHRDDEGLPPDHIAIRDVDIGQAGPSFV